MGNRRPGSVVVLALVALACAATALAGGDFVMVIDLPEGRVLSLSGDPEVLERPTTVGSTLKLFEALAALRSGYNPATSVLCPPSSIEVPAAERCWLVRGHGRLDLSGALAHSCSVSFRSLIRKVPRKTIRSVFADYRLVDPQTLALVEGMTTEDLIGATDVLRVSPGRLLGAGAALFGQTDMLDFQVRNDRVKTRRAGPAPHVAGVQLMRRALRRAALEGTFTDAQRLAPDCPVFGKTGTAPRIDSPSKWHGVFIGFAPYPVPDRAVIVVTEAGTGGGTAAPLGVRGLCSKSCDQGEDGAKSVSRPEIVAPGK